MLVLIQETPLLQRTDSAPAAGPRPPALWPRIGRRPQRRWPARTWLPSSGRSGGRRLRLQPIPSAAGGGAWTPGQSENVWVWALFSQQLFYLLSKNKSFKKKKTTLKDLNLAFALSSTVTQTITIDIWESAVKHQYYQCNISQNDIYAYHKIHLCLQCGDVNHARVLQCWFYLNSFELSLVSSIHRLVWIQNKYILF